MRLLLAAISVFSFSAVCDENNFYIGSSGSVGVLSGESFSGVGFGATIIGGYDLDSNYSIELGYGQYNDIKDQPITIEPTMYSFSGVMSYPLSERLSIFSKFGLVKWQVDLDFGGIDFRQKNGTDGLIGAGFEFESSNNFHWRQEYNYFQLDDLDGYSLTFSLIYHY